jgi:PAS domain S-box-containing protein
MQKRPDGLNAEDNTEDRRTEESLRLLNSAVLQSKEAILITDAQLDLPGPRVVFVNPAFTTMTGYTAEEIVGKTPRILQGPRTDKAVLNRLRLNLERGEVFEGEAINYRKDRTEFVLEWQIAPIRNASGKITHFVATQRDITARKQSEIALNRLAAIVQSSEDAIIGKDLNGIVSSWNRGAEKIFGYAASEMIGTSITRLIPADRQHEEHEILERIRRGQSVEHFETMRQNKHGRLIVVSVTASPIKDSAGKVIGVSKVARDITERKQEEAAQRATEARYRALFEYAPDGIVIADPKSYYVDANASMCQMLGYTREELIGLHASDIVVQDEIQQIEPAIAAISAKTGYRREWKFRRKDGSVFAADVMATMMPDGNMTGMIRDVTERKLAEEKLRLHEAVLRETGHIARVGGWSFEVATGKGYWTDEVARIHDLDPAAQVSKEIGLSYYSAESRQRIELALQEAVQHGTPYDLELEIKTAAGNHKWIRTIGHPITEQGKVVRVRGSFQDITERKHAELRLKLQYAVTLVLAEGASLERTSQKIIETLGEGLGWDLGELWKVDRVSQVLRRSEVWHPPSTEFLEFATASAKMTFVRGQGLPGRVWALGRPEWSPDIMQDPGFMRRALIGPMGLHGWIGFPIMLRNEILGVVGFFSTEVQQPDNELLAMLSTLGVQLGQFIEKQQLAEQFRQAQKMEAIGTLAGGIAHDFNNILSVIMGYAELIKMTVTDDPHLLESVDAMWNAGSRATKLVRQILTFSRREEIKREVLQLGPVVAETLKFLRATIPSAIEFKVDLAGNTPAVLADSTQVHQIVMNLGTNAWHAMKDRSGRLEVKLENFEVDTELAESHLHVRPGSYVRLSVSDTGKGMDRATMNRIFEPFFTTKGPDEGTGLGLSVVHGIMQGHDGAITVYSQPGEGTTFHLYFPALSGEVSNRETPATPISQGSGQRILVVDDEEALAQLEKRILTRLGYVVETRNRAIEALDLVRAAPDQFDLVITDMTMPVMSGVDLAQQLAQVRPALPVILTTGYPGSLKREQLRGMGIRELLLKPPSVQSLGTAVHRVLSQGNHVSA